MAKSLSASPPRLPGLRSTDDSLSRLSSTEKQPDSLAGCEDAAGTGEKLRSPLLMLMEHQSPYLGAQKEAPVAINVYECKRKLL